MDFHFYKYQGTGNDFIIADNRTGIYEHLSTQAINILCHRRFGVGADGLMLLNPAADGYHFTMKYYNANGAEGSMCGNGGRCLVQFAKFAGIQPVGNYLFMAIDGPHQAMIDETGKVSLKMIDVTGIETNADGDKILNTGSPHYIKAVSQISQYDVVQNGKSIRYNDRYQAEGINVNFIEKISENEIWVRTYERGVEDETYSCGTGVTAAGLVNYYNETGENIIHIHTLGGQLMVAYNRGADGLYTDVWLSGPAVQVYEGQIEI